MSPSKELRHRPSACPQPIVWTPTRKASLLHTLNDFTDGQLRRPSGEPDRELRLSKHRAGQLGDEERGHRPSSTRSRRCYSSVSISPRAKRSRSTAAASGMLLWPPFHHHRPRHRTSPITVSQRPPKTNGKIHQKPKPPPTQYPGISRSSDKCVGCQRHHPRRRAVLLSSVRKRHFWLRSAAYTSAVRLRERLSRCHE